MKLGAPMATIDLDTGRYRAVLFGLDTVIIDTASIHLAAWKHLFDHYLTARAPAAGEDHRPFTEADYARHVKGKTRVDAVLDFLASRGIGLPRGQVSDRTGQHSGYGLATLADHHLRDAVAASGVTVFGDAAALLDMLHRRHVTTGVVSTSSAGPVLDHAAVAGLFDVRVDRVLAHERCVPDLPDAAIYRETARALGVSPADTVVIAGDETGLDAARRGGFGLIIGIARTGPPQRLLQAGADRVITSLSEITVQPSPEGVGQRRLSTMPDALEHWDELANRLRGRRLVLLFDFDGTLTAIQDDPAAVTLPVQYRQVLQELAGSCPLAVISGRDLRDIRQRVRVGRLWYAGSHGFELAGPDDELITHDAGEKALPDLDEAERRLAGELTRIPGALVDRKRFALAVHYRHVVPKAIDDLYAIVRRTATSLPRLTITHGRKVIELVPDVDWNKGRALLWLLDHLKLTPGTDTVPLYAGDDLTDEDALHAIRNTGVGIVVRSTEHGDRPTWAHFAVDNPDALHTLLTRIAALIKTTVRHSR